MWQIKICGTSLCSSYHLKWLLPNSPEDPFSKHMSAFFEWEGKISLYGWRALQASFQISTPHHDNAISEYSPVAIFSPIPRTWCRRVWRPNTVRIYLVYGVVQQYRPFCPPKRNFEWKKHKKMRDTYLGAKSRSRATLTYGQGHHQLARLPFPALVSDGAYDVVE